MITVTQYIKDEWSRFAQAAYAINRNDIGHRYSAAASLPNNAQMTCDVYDRLQKPYRVWLVWNKFEIAA